MMMMDNCCTSTAALVLIVIITISQTTAAHETIWPSDDSEEILLQPFLGPLTKIILDRLKYLRTKHCTIYTHQIPNEFQQALVSVKKTPL